jgi:preprotein translocase subunit SecD
MVCGERKMKLTLKLWVLIIILFFSLLSIFGMPPKFFQEGVLITSVGTNSTTFDSGLRTNQIILEIDGQDIKTLGDYSNAIQGKFNSDESIKTIIKTNEVEAILFSKTAPEITISELKKTNIKIGLDLGGGSRGLVQAKDKKLSLKEVNDLVDIISNRLNVYGIEDMNIKPVSDLSGNNFMLIEIAGATPNDLEELISKQGKFEAKIGNQTVFIGGERDIASVCRAGNCLRLEKPRQVNDGNYISNFNFGVTLSEEAAQKHAEITQNLEVNSTPQGNYLSKNLDLYVDENLVDSLLISEGLKGRVTTQISISGSGSGATYEESIENAQKSMKKLQTILITGSLPYKLEIVKLDIISPTLGDEFIKSIFLTGIAVLFSVSIVIFFRYKKLKSSIALLITSVSEIIIILGISTFFGVSYDLPAIAGILATIGVGIDSQIIILDEARQKNLMSLKQKLKRAFSIILGTYFTALVSLLPLMSAGAGLLKGFAITTIIGITAGVLITRPAFVDMIKKIED